MILNSKAKKILCFGDSLTWGNFHSGIRFELKDRWTYKMQELLGTGFDVIEEGLRSRTTNIDDEEIPDRNGLTYFRACFESHDPVDILIYMLGTNDTKVKFNHGVESIIAGISETLDWMNAFNQKRKISTRVILIAPPQINVQYLKPSSSFDQSSNEKLIALADKLGELAKQRNVSFIDLSKTMSGAQNDGVHLGVEDNEKIAEVLVPICLK